MRKLSRWTFSHPRLLGLSWTICMGSRWPSASRCLPAFPLHPIFSSPGRTHALSFGIHQGAEPILKVIRRLEMSQLQEHCWHYMMTVIDQSNCLILHEFADR